jgi:hypothetical protein
LFVDWRGADGLALATGLLGIFATILIIRLRFTEPRPAESIPK